MPLGIEVTFGIGCVNRSICNALIIRSIMRINVCFLLRVENNSLIYWLIFFFEYIIVYCINSINYRKLVADKYKDITLHQAEKIFYIDMEFLK